MTVYFKHIHEKTRKKLTNKKQQRVSTAALTIGRVLPWTN